MGAMGTYQTLVTGGALRCAQVSARSGTTTLLSRARPDPQILHGPRRSPRRCMDRTDPGRVTFAMVRAEVSEGRSLDTASLRGPATGLGLLANSSSVRRCRSSVHHDDENRRNRRPFG
jgi:hypothetical protein